MKTIFINILSAAGLVLCPALVNAQADLHFSQFYETSILRNPALTGIFTNDYKVGGFYRNQWSSISHPYVTSLGFAEVRVSVGRVSDDFVSFGVLGYTDKAGSLNQKISSFYPAVNYSKALNPDRNTYLSVGFTAGYTQYSFDPSKITVNNQFQGGVFDPNNPTLESVTNSKLTMWDLGCGVNYNSSAGNNNNITYIVGISGYHLTQPKFSYFDVPGVTQNMRWNVNGAIGFGIKENITTQVQTNFALQGTYFEQMTGVLTTMVQAGAGTKPLYAISGGLFYRFQDAIIPVIKLKYKNTAIAGSYDVNVSKLKQASKLRGGYELTFSITGDWSDKSGILKKTVCPKF
ncbi:MAG: PorP/SprF family type IX secretion system membrane protein [Taibaiella sp.]|nr:PorP/SprF family type IX secretion system membrane protein [Taibaiella sp.]